MESIGNQDKLRLAFGVHREPKNAPIRLVVQLENEAQALAVAIRSGGHKLAYIASSVGKSESYICRLASGERRIPKKLIGPLCAATGTNLLRQYIELQNVEEDVCDIDRLAQLLRAA